MPFTVEEFLQVFAEYNRAIWPAHIIAYTMGLAAVLAVVGRARWRGRFVTAVLALFWLWMGVAYHMVHFSRVNRPAYVFGAFFVLQGILFAIAAARRTLKFEKPATGAWATGGLFVLYAMVIYPILGMLAGHGWPQAPMFGVAPCPTTIFTFGLLLWTGTGIPKRLIVIPFLWSLIGFSAAIHLDVYEDFGLVVAGVVGTTWIVLRNQSMSQQVTEAERESTAAS